jgi:hypothetical protein
MRLHFPALALLVLAGSTPAPAQSGRTEPAGSSPLIEGDGLKRTVFCQRARVTVRGSGNEVVMHGPCERVAVFGTDHRIAIEEVGSLSVQGSGHRVRWVRGLDGGPPKISERATGTTVERISPEDFAKIPPPTAHE